jgi:hypothetical protein
MTLPVILLLSKVASLRSAFGRRRKIDLVVDMVRWKCEACEERNSGRADEFLKCRRCGLRYEPPLEADDSGVTRRTTRSDAPVAFTPARQRLSKDVKLYCGDCYAKKFGGIGSAALWPEQVRQVAKSQGQAFLRCAECGSELLAAFP